MDDHTIAQHLKDMQYVHASKALHEKMQQSVSGLPDKHKGFYFPLFAFQFALIAIVILVLAGVGSGVVLAARGSHPGTPLYPIRKLIQKVAPEILQDNPTPASKQHIQGDTNNPTSTPTATPTHAPKDQEHHHIQRGSDDKNTSEDETTNEGIIVPTIEKKVEGIQSRDDTPHNEDNQKHQGLLQQLFDK